MRPPLWNAVLHGFLYTSSVIRSMGSALGEKHDVRPTDNVADLEEAFPA